MRFRSTNSNEQTVSFKDAILGCLPADGGLYVPDRSMDLRRFFLHMDEEIEFHDLVSEITPNLFEDDITPSCALRIAQSASTLEPELIRLDDDYSLLDLSGGSTGVFKDFGIAFLAAAVEELRKNSGRHLVLAAARDDTGVSMADALCGREGLNAVLLYPSGPIRGLDPAAYAPNGGNIIPIQVRGTFDDCQRLIRDTIRDQEFAARYNITSANTINPGRLLPQTLYYLYGFIRAKKHLSGGIAFSVPCGNFGNLIAGLYAWQFGMPVNGLIAAMNSNNTLFDFFRGNPFSPRRLVNTNSPALDVRIPSNLGRLESFYQEYPAVMRNMVYPASVSDELTLMTIEYVWKKYNRDIDPHTAVAFAAAEQVAESHHWKGHTHTVILATGHYAKYPELVRKATGRKISTPTAFRNLRKKTDPIALIPPQLDAFENAIASCF